MITRQVLNVFMFLAMCVAQSVPTMGGESGWAQNAALQYWKAFALCPELSREQDDALLKSLKQGAIDETLRKVIKSCESALRELHKGAQLRECCWGISLEEGPNAVLPHLSKARQLSKVACLRAHASFQQDQASQAAEDIGAVMTLARHIGKDSVLISLLVDYAMERMAIETIAANLPSFDANQLETLVGKLDALPPQPTVCNAVIAEKEMYAEWVIQVLTESDGKDRLIALFDGTDSDAVKAIREHSRGELLAGAQQLRAFYDRLAEAVKLPPDEVKQAEKRLMANPGVDGPAREMALGLVPAIGAARHVEATHQTRLALLQAAVAVQQHGPDVLKEDAYRDPFGTSPFTYIKTENGFKLQSSFTERTDQPVSLTVGRP